MWPLFSSSWDEATGVPGAGEGREPCSHPAPSTPRRHTQPWLPGKGHFTTCRSRLPVRFRQLGRAPLLLTPEQAEGSARTGPPSAGRFPGCTPPCPPLAQPPPAEPPGARALPGELSQRHREARRCPPRWGGAPAAPRRVLRDQVAGTELPLSPGHRQRQGRGQRGAVPSSPSQHCVCTGGIPGLPGHLAGGRGRAAAHPANTQRQRGRRRKAEIPGLK